MSKTDKILIVLIAAVASFFIVEAMAEGVVYQDGVDTVLTTSCDPPTERTDGTPITPQEMDMTKIILSQDRLFPTSEHEVIIANIFCNQDFALANLSKHGQWYKTAQIHAMDGGWSANATPDVPFEWLAAIVPPPTLSPIIPQADWTLHAVSSEELENWPMPAIQAWDGNTNTLWHSQYSPTEEPMPHYVSWHLGGIYKVDGFQMQPRPDGGNGTPENFNLSVSMNGSSWTPVFAGTAPAGDAIFTGVFPAVNAKYLKFEITSNQDGTQQGAVAELYAYGNLVVLKPPKPPKNLK